MEQCFVNVFLHKIAVPPKGLPVRICSSSFTEDTPNHNHNHYNIAYLIYSMIKFPLPNFELPHLIFFFFTTHRILLTGYYVTYRRGKFGVNKTGWRYGSPLNIYE